MALPNQAVRVHDARARDCFNVVIGLQRESAAPSHVREAVDDLKRSVTRLTGGVTLSLSEGTWAAKANQNNFSGPIEDNVAINLLVTLLPSDTPTVWPRIEAEIRHLVRAHQLSCEAVHVMAWRAQSHIFSISGTDLFAPLNPETAV